MSGPRVAIADYGMGNRRSVEKALERVGARPVLTSDAAALGEADGVVLPGVGAFPQAVRNLRDRGLGEALRECVARGVPVLGVCLGMQLLFESSEENEGADGLGLLGGKVERLPVDGGLKLPHIGWSRVTLERPSPLTEGLPEACAFYHVHSFAPRPRADELVVGRAEYGAPFASIVAHPEEPLYGVQFHPEKSSAHGLRLLANFAAVCGRVAAAA